MFVRKCLAILLLCLLGGAPPAIALGIATHEMLAHSLHEASGGEPGLHVDDHAHHHDHELPAQDRDELAPPVRPRDLSEQSSVVLLLVACIGLPPSISLLQVTPNPSNTRDGPHLPVLLCTLRI